MRPNRFVISVKIAILFTVLLATQANGLAQSAMTLVAHYVEVTPVGDGVTYKINLYFSVLDQSGNPVKDLNAESFKLLEDSQMVEIQEFGIVAESPINIVLVMDTSGTMSGARIKDAKDAAINLVSALMKSDSQAAVVTFDDEVETQINFTSDKKTIADGINRINATRGAGACLYDAAFAAIQAVSTLPIGNRAVVLLTDSRDETSSLAICSTHTLNEVIKAAAEGETRTPIHIISLGTDIDSETLKKIANQTGGLYLFSSDSPQLANTFQYLSDRLSSQYALTYLSVSRPGAHTLGVRINQSGASVQDTRNFLLPALPAQITFTKPFEGETIDNLLELEVVLSTQGEIAIGRVAFEVNGKEAGADDTKPYELEVDVKQYPVGIMTVSAVAYDLNNTEVARSSLNLVHAEALIVPSAEVIPPVSATPTSPETSNLMVIMAIILSGVSIFAIVFLLFFLLRQQKKEQAWNVEDLENGDKTIPSFQRATVHRQVDEYREPASLEIESDALGALTVEASDDSSMIGHRFEITTSLVTLGRSADNDINFPSDKPVSRHHAEIYQISGKLYLREVETAGVSGATPPKYGTFINQKPLGSDPVLLQTGDEIQLGKRVRLKFESYTRNIGADALTSDDYDTDVTVADDIDKTALQD